MKQLIILAMAFAVMMMACHKKTVPAITSRTEFPSAPKSTQQPIVDNSPEAIAAGKTIYTGKCNRCHDLKEPDEYTADRWASILKTMIPRARLDDQQAKEVTAYVLANAKK